MEASSAAQSTRHWGDVRSFQTARIDTFRQRGNGWAALSVDLAANSARRGISMKKVRSLVVVIDDDESVRESLPDLLNELGVDTQTFSSGAEFFASDCVSGPGCLILDVAMPGMSGPDIQRELQRRKQKVPVIFITAQRDEALRSRLIKQGAVACLFKPFSDTDLLEALNASLRR
jgi:FixJ family two-component response regulator